MYPRLLVCALLMGVAGVAGAHGSTASQQPAAQSSSSAAPQLTAQQRAEIRHQNQIMVHYAAVIAQAIDHGQIGQVWDQASDIAKHAVTRDAFVKAIQSDRARLGTMTSRKLAFISRNRSNGSLPPGRKTGAPLPAGFYINIGFATQFSKQAKPIRELVSFHLDSDHKWRVSGYSVRPVQVDRTSK
jgi:Protein of unknown function (DUF4019)